MRAEMIVKSSLTNYRDLGDLLGLANCFEQLVVLAASARDFLRAVRLAGAADTIRQGLGPATVMSGRAEYVETVETVRGGLSDATFELAWAEGRAMTLAQAIRYALGGADDPWNALMSKQVIETGGQPMAAQTVVPPDAAGPSSPFRILMLGYSLVYVSGCLLNASDWKYAKAREFFFYLLTHPSRTREEIGLALWPDASAEQLRNNFHQIVYRARRALGKQEWITFEHQTYQFNRSLAYWSDVETFEREIAAAQSELNAEPGAEAQAVPHLQQAIALYRGDFLDDLGDQEWARPRRAELRHIFLEALLTLGRLWFAEGRYAQAAEIYHRAITHDSYLEVAHRELMRCYARRGDHSQAMRHYRTLVTMLRHELGISPAPETAALADKLRRGEPI